MYVLLGYWGAGSIRVVQRGGCRPQGVSVTLLLALSPSKVWMPVEISTLHRYGTALAADGRICALSQPTAHARQFWEIAHLQDAT